MTGTFQIEVPESEYPGYAYMAPHIIREWVHAAGLNYTFVGSNSSGDGYDEHGRSNRHIVYIIRNANEGDDVLFKIHFPSCKVYPLRK